MRIAHGRLRLGGLEAGDNLPGGLHVHRARVGGEELQIVGRPVVSLSRLPRLAIILRSDLHAGEVVGIVADGRNIELTQVLERRHVGTGRLAQRGAEADRVARVRLHRLFLGARCHGESRQDK